MLRFHYVREFGFTLIELLVTVALVAVIAGVAVPSFANLVGESRLTTSANRLNSVLNLTRSEAIKRNQTLTLCSLTKCDGDLSDGWQLRLSASPKTVIRQHDRAEGGVSITADAALQFNAFGRPTSASARCLEIQANEGSRWLEVSPSGAIATVDSCS